MLKWEYTGAYTHKLHAGYVTVTVSRIGCSADEVVRYRIRSQDRELARKYTDLDEAKKAGVGFLRRIVKKALDELNKGVGDEDEDSGEDY